MAHLKHSILDADQDALRQNSQADRYRLDLSHGFTLAEFESGHRLTVVRVGALKQMTTVKKSNARRHEDRIAFYRGQVEAVLRQTLAA